MHTWVVYLAAVWIAALFAATVVLVIRAPSSATRILMLHTLNLIVVALLALVSSANQAAFYLDAALLLALLAFVGTVAAARFHTEGRIFS